MSHTDELFPSPLKAIVIYQMIQHYRIPVFSRMLEKSSLIEYRIYAGAVSADSSVKEGKLKLGFHSHENVKTN